MGLRRFALVAVAAFLCLAATHTEDNQFHFFPGGVGGPGGNILQFGAVPNAGTDQTGPLQAAIDSGLSPLVWPAGTYLACNLFIRASNQVWIGAGKGQTILSGTAGCNNITVTSFGGLFPGPVQEFAVSGFTFSGGVQAQLNLQCRDIERVTIRDNAFDTGGVGCPTTSAGPNGITIQGCRDFVIEDNEFYSSCPASGGRGMLLSGTHGGVIQRNTSNWQRTFTEIGTTANQPSEFLNFSDNIFHGTFWGTPTKYTNSGGTVTYSATGLTDTNANFAGLCDGGGASPCAAAAGSFVRVLTAKVNGTTGTFNTAGGYLTDTGANFTGAGVIRGDIVRTTPVCFGNGALSSSQRFVCTGGAGNGLFGDSCVCTTNSDCASNVCEPRFATVDTVGTSTTLQVDEWSRDTTCTQGSGICTTSSRRPTGAILSTAGVAYTIFGWTACQVASYTATSLTCTNDNWFNWTGSAATPANFTLYEVMWTRGLYNLLAGNNGTGVPGNSSQQQTQNIHVVNNVAVGGFPDHFEMFGTQNVVANNVSRDCGDTCIVVSGDRNTVTGNRVDHCGARGLLMQTNDSTATANVASDSPFIRSSNTTVLAEIGNFGNRNAFTGNKAVSTLPTNLNRYGYVSFGNATGNSDSAVFQGNSCQGSYSVGCYRMDATGGTTTNNHFIDYHGEVISNNGGTFTIEGGLSTQALITANAAGNGSFAGCSDCTVANPCAAAGTGAVAKRQNGAWVCN